MERQLDFLHQCAQNFNRLLDFSYYFVIARKGIQREFRISFHKTDFHHLAGLHKLTDKRRLQHGSRETLFDRILQGEFDTSFLESSFHFDEMKERLAALVNLEKLLDSENLIFKYNENVRICSSIKSDYLLEGDIDDQTLFLFLGERFDDNPIEQVCRSFFPKSKIDYSVGQPRYTLLKKEKISISDGLVLSSYER